MSHSLPRPSPCLNICHLPSLVTPPPTANAQSEGLKAHLYFPLISLWFQSFHCSIVADSLLQVQEWMWCCCSCQPWTLTHTHTLYIYYTHTHTLCTITSSSFTSHHHTGSLSSVDRTVHGNYCRPTKTQLKKLVCFSLVLLFKDVKVEFNL